MSIITGLTAARMLAIEAASVIAGVVNGSGHLILTKHDGSTIDAGSVAGPTGPPGPPSSLNQQWPVGSIYMSVNATNPSTALGGGTWTAWGQGRVPVSVDPGQTEFDTVEETGGEKAHTLTVAEMPSHTHGAAGDHKHSLSLTGATGSQSYPAQGAGAGGVTQVADNGVSLSGSHTHPAAGGGGAHNNLQPYITCYMWKRTA